ncbi:MAG TPA: prepilin-type N-terminal cleavage/methylation domain-containing protein [Mycobacteriales bacterium]|jgi:prepilin-type N-terminal cleavage/methylation domain-containing protein
MNTLLKRVRRGGDTAGFTLVELLVVIILMGVVGAMVTTSIASSLRADRRTRSRVDTSADMTKGFDRITKQIRVAAPVISFSSTSIAVETYRNGARRRFTYTYDSAAKTVTEKTDGYASATAVSPSTTSTRVLLTNVTNGATPMFKYYDRDGVVATQIKDIARVEVTLVEKPKEQNPVVLSTSVYLRNFQEQ